MGPLQVSGAEGSRCLGCGASWLFLSTKLGRETEGGERDSTAGQYSGTVSLQPCGSAMWSRLVFQPWPSGLSVAAPSPYLHARLDDRAACV